MIKVTIRGDGKLATTRFNHPVECNKFKEIMLEKQKDPHMNIKIKIRDERG